MITFVYPDFESIGVESLMAVSLREGYEVNLVFYYTQDPYLGHKTSISYPQIAQRIIDTKPDLVAFSCVTTNYIHQLNCAKYLKNRSDVPVIFGGVHTTAVPERVLENKEVDAVAIGEAENSFAKLLKGEWEVEGIIKETPINDLDTLPYSHKDLFAQYLPEITYKYTLMTSRGCPYNCSYCFNSTTHKRQGNRLIRQRSVDNVIGELQSAKEKYDIKNITFYDDCFAKDSNWLDNFRERYKKDIGLPFSCIAHPDYITKETAKILKDAGCVDVQIGVQSLQEGIAERILHRHINKHKIIQTIENLKKVKIMVNVDHLLGIWEDNLYYEEESILFYNDHRPDLINIFWLTIYPKTDIVDLAKESGQITDEDIEKIENGEVKSYLEISDKRYNAIAFLLSWMIFIPRWVIKCLICWRLYPLIKVNSYFLIISLPNAIKSIFDKRYFRGRYYIKRFFNTRRLE